MAKYVVLRGLKTAPSGFPSPLEAMPGIAGAAGPAAPGMGDVAVETEDMSSSDVREVQRDPSVLGVARSMPIKLIEPMEVDAAGGAAPTWGVEAVGAFDSPFDGSNVRVAVLDTGIDKDHPAFQGVTLNQRDFSGDGDQDANGHGTHCAGTIFGRDVDGTRIGVARGVTNALIGKVLGDDGRGSSEMLFNAMTWASENNAQVISMSLGFDFPGFSKRLADSGLPVDIATSIALEAYRMNLRVFDRILALFQSRAAFNGGTVVCAASGNESRRDQNPDFEVSASVPAAAEGVVSVGALQQGSNGLGIASFSNTNPTLSAPGVGIVSARTGGGLATLSGTSMACPHTTGVAALWWHGLAQSAVPSTANSVVVRLLANCRANAISPNVEIADRGQGLVQAPSANMF